MTRWIGPFAIACLAALAGWYLTLAAAPQFIMGRAWERLAEQAGVNRMTHSPQVTAERQTIVRPSPDLAYSVCAFDLSAGPIRFHAQPVPDHYWSLTVFDSETNVAFVESDRESRGEPVEIVLATVDQTVPDGARRITMPSAKGVALLRVLLNDAADFDAVAQDREQSYCRPVQQP
ncbi:DUF1254 domain-containing protein [Blastomonas sp.]|uniref:DUF1254 domain-containing protein n=1 Tax=Blastomonas sp. TaxID=1909299 RepID=UPI00261FF644|nr:DUF1254 domain-containing protein [Blastomonas sp.]MDM7958085.1 DUF1254 domain-containing protein [Blastomonas sp.]